MVLASVSRPSSEPLEVRAGLLLGKPEMPSKREHVLCLAFKTQLLLDMTASLVIQQIALPSLPDQNRLWLEAIERCVAGSL